MTRILDRYVLRELSAPLAISVGVFTFFLVIDRVYQLTDLVITKQVPFRLVLLLLGFLLPSLLTLTLPVALLLAVLVSCGRLTGDFEVAALKASGVSPFSLFRPFLVAGLTVSLLVACLTLVVNPWAAAAFQNNLFEILQSRAVTGIEERTFNTAFAPIVLYVEEVSPSQVALKRVLASDERNQALSRIIVAREGRVLADQETRRVTLRFIDGSINETDAADPRRFRHTTFTIYDLNLRLTPSGASTGQETKPEREMSLGQLMATARALAAEGPNAAPYRVELHKRFALPVAGFIFVLVAMPEHVDDFIRVHRRPDTMSFFELRAYVAKLRSGGHQVGAYLVQLHSKLSFPLVHVIMALVAIPFALSSPRSGGRAVGIGVALVIAVGYWMVNAVAVAFGRADLLPPVLAAWTANIIFAGVGTVLLLKART